jgi:hypothetical protein
MAPDKTIRVRPRKLPINGSAGREKNMNIAGGCSHSEGDRPTDAGAASPDDGELIAVLTDCVRHTFRGELSPHRLQSITLALAERSRLRKARREGHPPRMGNELFEDILTNGLPAAEGTHSEGDRPANANTAIPNEGELVAVLTDCVRRTSRGVLSPHRLEAITGAIAECCRLLSEGYRLGVEDQSTCAHLLALHLIRQNLERPLRQAGQGQTTCL